MDHLCDRCRVPSDRNFDAGSTHWDYNPCPYAANFREDAYEEIRSEQSDDTGNSGRHFPEWDPCMTVFRTEDNGGGYDITECTFFRCLWNHADYIQSPAWQEKRRQVLERDGYCCTRCGSAVNLDVHHLTYSHFGNEPLEDLVTLCRRCHGTIHKKI